MSKQSKVKNVKNVNKSQTNAVALPSRQKMLSEWQTCQKCKAMQSNAKQSHAKQCKAMQSNAKQSKATQSKAKQCKTMQSNARQ